MGRASDIVLPGISNAADRVEFNVEEQIVNNWSRLGSWQSLGGKRLVWFAGSVLALVGMSQNVAAQEDWSRFLGTRGTATTDSADIPTVWSATENIQWKASIPGPGASSPVVLGDRVYLTCYTGYGVEPAADMKTSDQSAGNIADLTRHLICFDRSNGEIVWQKPIANDKVQNEDPYKSYITYHGYATNTPITDGESIYAFFGKAGIIAFDLEGKQLWIRSFEGEPNKTRWGSAASLIFHGDQLIVNAIDECGKILSLNKTNGEITWEFDAQSRMAYSTPGLIKTESGELELVVAIAEKVYGLDPDTGEQKWFAKTVLMNEVNAAIIVEDDIAYIYGGYQGVGSLAVRGGGKGDVTKSHVLWTANETSYVSTPVLKDKRIYWVDKSGIAYCVDAESGNRLYRQRVPGFESGRGVKIFASMVLAGERLYAVSRNSGTFIWLANDKEFQLIQHNVIEGDDSPFNGTPAMCGDQIFIRSNKFLYCISE